MESNLRDSGQKSDQQTGQTESVEASGSPKYWLSLEQWRQDPEFKKMAEKEFLSSPLQNEEGQGGWARREFLKLMGASLALTSFGCVRRPAQKIVPYVNAPHEITPGLANYYASSWSDGNTGYGIVVTTREGRPIKIEGNPEHPANRGGMSARATAHILSLYDPDRLTAPRRHLFNEGRTNFESVSISWADMDQEVVEQLQKGGVAVLTSSLLSPSTQALVDDFSQAFGGRHYRWEPLSQEPVRAAAEACYGGASAVVPDYRLDRARLILSVGSDFLGSDPKAVSLSRQWAEGRKPGPEMSKVVVFESLMTLTGMNADERYRVKSSQYLHILMGLLHQIIVVQERSRYAGNAQVIRALQAYAGVARSLGLDTAKWAELASDLWANRGRSLVMASSAEGPDTQAIQVAANFLNSVLENDGKTIDYRNASPRAFQGSARDLKDLITGLEDGSVKTVIIHRSNPVFSLPSSAGLVEALRKAELVVYTGDRVEETGRLAHFMAPDHHSLENWGDGEFVAGVYSVQQPTIRPLYETRAFEDSLLNWSKASDRASLRLRQADSWYDFLRQYWRSEIYNRHRSVVGDADFESFWISLLQKGVFDTSRLARETEAPARNFNLNALQLAGRGQERSTDSDGFELVLYPTVGLADGSLANVSWLQEFPDPVTKICWDNYLSVSVKDAADLKLRQGQVVQLRVGDQGLEVPVHIQPGQVDGVVGLAVGYGRSHAGKVADGVGVNAYSLLAYKEGRCQYLALPVQIEKLGKQSALAVTQGHHSMEGRQIVVEATLAQFNKKPDANIYRHKIFSLWSEHKYPRHKWGMVVDLNTCTGCSACVIACQSENNVPVVGKRYVMQGRIMQWIRLDRYYVGEPEDATAVFMPMLCQHCDNAPCETVCPVLATVQSDEGTNDMIYNRCVGTRYCANNCPYKVRRFNWFNYAKDNFKAPLNQALNPDVTVRSRGVMEKCTFCIHRIKGAQQQARTENRTLKDGDVKSACQQACPTGAIVFGDLNDKESAVAKLFHEPRSYAVLEEFNIRPAVHYQTKIRNTDKLKGDSNKKEGQHA